MVYFKRVLALEPSLGAQQEAAKEGERLEELKEARRKGTLYLGKAGPRVVRRFFDRKVVSHRLRAVCIIDCILEVEGGHLIPVEYKAMASKKGKAYSAHKYQLGFQAVVLEEAMKRRVVEGYINYLQDGRTVRILMTPNLRRYVLRLIEAIREDLRRERLPPITVSPKKCWGGCGYRRICYG